MRTSTRLLIALPVLVAACSGLNPVEPSQSATVAPALHVLPAASAVRPAHAPERGYMVSSGRSDTSGEGSTVTAQ
jgi:hypothetical protein